MKLGVLLGLLLMLNGCVLLPSQSDPNQNERFVDLVIAAQQLDCEQAVREQAVHMHGLTNWILVHAEFSGWRNRDVIDIAQPIQETVDGLIENHHNQFYCEIVREQLIDQTRAAAGAMLRRMR